VLLRNYLSVNKQTSVSCPAWISCRKYYIERYKYLIIILSIQTNWFTHFGQYKPVKYDVLPHAHDQRIILHCLLCKLHRMCTAHAMLLASHLISFFLSPRLNASERAYFQSKSFILDAFPRVSARRRAMCEQLNVSPLVLNEPRLCPRLSARRRVDSRAARDVWSRLKNDGFHTWFECGKMEIVQIAVWNQNNICCFTRVIYGCLTSSNNITNIVLTTTLEHIWIQS